MANVTVKHLIDLVAGWLQDEDETEANRHWPESDLVGYYNRAASKIVSRSPEANIVTEAVKLASGSKQSLPPKAIAFNRLIRNMGTDGETPGQSIVPCDLTALESSNLNWNTETAAATILNGIPDPISPTGFYVYPQSDGTTYVLAQFSAVPEEIVWDEDGNWESAMVEVNEKYVDAVLKEMLAYAYKKDSDFPGNKERENDSENEALQDLAVLRA